jgi:hypothetical protein
VYFTAAIRTSFSMHNYSSYLIRHWLLGNDSDEHGQVFDIEHVQSGRRTQLTKLSEAEPWMEAIAKEKQAELSESRPEDF